MNNPANPNIPQPRNAATVILLRENGRQPFEFFLMRRHRNQSFMGGAFVFPGGALDAADCDPGLEKYVKNGSAQKIVARLNEHLTQKETSLGLFFAAVRETFEEAGVLLADLLPDQNLAQRCTSYRKALHSGSLSLKALADSENIFFALDDLMPYSRWITPEIEGKRFDTRFFVARMPKHQKSEHDHVELVDSLWITPEEALKKQVDHEILLMPPTLKTIEELASYDSIDALYLSLSGRKILPILPQAFETESGFGVKLPHDPEYTIEEYKQPHREDDPSRVVMIEGRFKTMFIKAED
jgi:8-oxo-dGTP pyrophosphatase MutT (NUDIX family)